MKLNSINDKALIEIYNGVGQLIYSEHIQLEVTNINLKAYSDGFYYVKVKNGGQEEVRKIIKQ